mmetsp:Transcript_11378/g.20573  ORF Transcript_11378/g.20573 Transcript_11378/m.20573 type:complete len:411 (-) Transcript_11378:419-1651(-)
MSAPWQQAGAGATALPVDGVSENPSSANGAAVPNTAARSRAIMRRALSPAAVPVWRTAGADLPKKQRVVMLPQQARKKSGGGQHGSRARLVSDSIEEGSETQSEAEDSSAQRDIRMFCIAERLDLVKLAAVLRGDPRVGAQGLRKFPADAPEVLHVNSLEGAVNGGRESGSALRPGDIFFFDFGVVVFWCTTVAEEIEVLRSLVAPVEINSVKARDATWDQFSLNFTNHEQPSIQNDIITISRRSSGVKTKLALSCALAQSTKLLLYEKEVQKIAGVTRFIPEELARTGGCSIRNKDLNRLTGNIFVKAQSLNLVDPIMSMPEWMESEPNDRLVEMYKRVCVYLDIDDRVTILDSRLACFKDLLALLRNQHHDRNNTNITWLIIILLVFCCALSLVKGIEMVSRFMHGTL